MTDVGDTLLKILGTGEAGGGRGDTHHPKKMTGLMQTHSGLISFGGINIQHLHKHKSY